MSKKINQGMLDSFFDLKSLLLSLLLIPCVADAKESTCYGNTSNGRLENAVQLPSKGKNYISYSMIARLAGRTYTHSAVRDIIVAAYHDLELTHPDKLFKYAETGLKEGGKFNPHKTHRNGLSVDFMTPVLDKDGISKHLPTHPLNRFGYDIEFDQNNEYNGLHIDFQALAAHIVALDKQAKQRGFDLWRVIFAPELQAGLFKTEFAAYLKQHIQFSKKRSWVRHDEHYHIDFEIPCNPLK